MEIMKVELEVEVIYQIYFLLMPQNLSKLKE
jgi:hypothetical protein